MRQGASGLSVVPAGASLTEECTEAVKNLSNKNWHAANGITPPVGPTNPLSFLSEIFSCDGNDPDALTPAASSENQENDIK